MAHVADGAHGDGWARSARLAFEKSPRRPAGRSPRPNLPYTRANKRLHLALKKHAEGERVTRPWHEAEDRGGGGNPQGDGDGLKEVEERCSPMPVTLISAAGHAALFHYCTTMLVPGKQVGWLDEEDGARRRMERKGVDGSVDRSGWCIGTNAFAVKTGDARGNGVFLQQQPARGVWIWAKESDTVGGWIVSRGRVPYTAALCLFLKLLFQTLTTSIFLSPFLPLFAFSLRSHLYAGEWTRDRRSPGGKRFYELAARAARWSMIRIGSSTCFFLQEKKKKLEEYISFSIRFLLLLWVKGEMSSNNRSTCNIFNFIEC